ncbi:MAG: hypothetical protein Q4D62_08350 [Planctomycetia bacterium]|nr:hypothetical protein [Planctomycetia bacterium]
MKNPWVWLGLWAGLSLTCVGGEIPRPAEKAPVEKVAWERAVLRGVDFLLKRQNRDGSWGSPRQTKHLNIYAPGSSHDGYRTGTTALVLESLLRTEQFLQTLPRQGLSEELQTLLSRKEELTEAIDRCENWLLEHLPQLRRSSPDVLYNNWGHAYGLQALKGMGERKVSLPAAELAQRHDSIREQMRKQVELLQRFECLDGGWCYYDFDFQTQKTAGSSLSFMTATVLVGLADARDFGVDVPEVLVRRGIDSILRQRRPDGAYAYGEYLIRFPASINQPQGSLGRSQACHEALLRWGRSDVVTQQVLLDWMDRLMAQNGWLDIARKRPVPHESHYQIAAYFYYYAHYYAARNLAWLEKPEDRGRLANHLVSLQLALQEKDGSWWDFPLYDYHPYYGTGMVLTSLLEAYPSLFGR